jgi:hypothetical protein
MLKLLKINPDRIGYTSAALCTVHCFATPFIFITQACSKTCCAETPVYWQAIDYLFLAISFSAVFFAVKKCAISWIKYGLIASWIFLAGSIFSESFSIFPISEYIKYISAFSLISLHLYNHWQCSCSNEKGIC